MMNSKKQFVGITLISWFAMLGIDFFIHGGLMADFYAESDPFLHPLEEAFRLIPLGYLSFLINAGLSVWLMNGFGIEGWRDGMMFGLKYGVLTATALVLGLYSIAPAPTELLIGWFFSQTIEMGIGAGVIGRGFQAEKLRPLFWNVFIGVLAMFVLTVVLQNI